MKHLSFLLLLLPLLAFAKGKPDTLWTRTIGRVETAHAILAWEGQRGLDTGERSTRPDSLRKYELCLVPSAIRTTADNGFVVAGTFGREYDHSRTIFVLKTDEAGGSQWMKFFRRGRGSRAEDVWPTKDGGYLVSATIESLGEGLRQVWILRLDATGDTLWTQMYRVHHYNDAGPIRETSDGGCLVMLRTAVKPNHGPVYFHMVKLDRAGTPLWGRSYGETELGYGAGYLAGAELTADWGVVFAGTMGQNNERCLSVVRTDSLGSIVWNKHFPEWDGVTDLAHTANGDYVIAGRTSVSEHDLSVPCLMRLTENGDSIWFRSFEEVESSEIRSCIELRERDLAFTGQHFENRSIDDRYWVEVLSRKGLPRRTCIVGNDPISYKFEGKLAREGIAMTLAQDGGLVIAGRTWPDAMMMYDVLDITNVCQYPTDLFLVKFRSHLGR